MAIHEGIWRYDSSDGVEASFSLHTHHDYDYDYDDYDDYYYLIISK